MMLAIVRSNRAAGFCAASGAVTADDAKAADAMATAVDWENRLMGYAREREWCSVRRVTLASGASVVGRQQQREPGCVYLAASRSRSKVRGSIGVQSGY